ncbi:hypothetical protein GSI_07809 [Ganoderma sinense ZZ0214-1]|uniref:Uncharacterized protein n=1 Tax=Ganoderma sinense ZZ0214-1 TaxID=1077348 RepID=A0A2G8S7Z7_9APHY|nr:hypothetical protein GSI_07809 [Ganoderma sinense ZZ0214-1]
MSLESGQYIITSAFGGYGIGRRTIEDRSLMPKGIYVLPQDAESPWHVERLEDGTYKLKNKGDLVGSSIIGQLLAFLLPGGEIGATMNWTFRPDVKSGNPDAWVITEVGGHGRAWSVPDSNLHDIPHVVVKPLAVGLSEPPTFPPTEVFIFKKVDV